MTHPIFLREKARQLRVSKKLTIDELSERLLVSRSTIYYWVRDLPAIPATERGLGIEPASIKLQRKSNSSQLRLRNWRCRYGVLSVSSWDTLLRVQLEAWMTCLRASWA